MPPSPSRTRAGELLTGVCLFSVIYFFMWLGQPYMPYVRSRLPAQRSKQANQQKTATLQRLRHFADWSDNSSEYHILREVEQGFVETFLEAPPPDESIPALEVAGDKLCSLELWLSRWGAILDEAKTFHELPVWLQYFPRVMFQVINKSGTGEVTRDELSAFYSSVLGLGAQRVGEVLDCAYKAMTANGDHPLCFPAYRWCFANFLLGRHRNGPGQFLFGPGEAADLRECPFPVDYSALNTAPEELEQYSPDRKSNRRSVVV